MLFKKLVQKFNTQKINNASCMINPFDANLGTSENKFLGNLTENALKMYERRCDVRNFSKLVLSNPENTSHNDMAEELFAKGVIDPFEDDKLAHLADNKNLLKDLGLTD